jgi:hypothetical protein
MINANWEKELGIPIRWPRPPIKAMEEILKVRREPQIFLKRESDGDAIVIKFPIDATDELLRYLGEYLPIAFEEVLWKSAEDRGRLISSLRLEISESGWRIGV